MEDFEGLSFLPDIVLVELNKARGGGVYTSGASIDDGPWCKTRARAHFSM